ncbi:MAG: D-alanyl-D-alanine carboxypeptidase family protein [Ruminococcaceae bacterium]|nr:D-alanyl-D-alanine carboxypeptidase family protein [Oscillospiraceae bacterium]
MNWYKKIICIILSAVTAASMFACGGDGDTNDGGCDDKLHDPYLLLANKQHALDENFVPPNLVDVSASYTMRADNKEYRLQATAAEAVEKMLRDMHAAGYSGVLVTSAYRTYAYQKSLFNYYISAERERNPSFSDAQLEAKVLTYSARPGTSEHQTGLCVDLFDVSCMKELENYGYEGTKDDVGFAETGAFVWLKAHAHEYGFILRYPEDKVSVTGYQYESWHYRYVGIEAAKNIHQRGITLEEYLGK